MHKGVCGGYIRVSTAAQEKEGYSLQTQVQRFLTFCTKNNFEPVIYQEVESGSTIDNRPRLNELLADTTNNKIKAVWVIESSRLSRNLEDDIRIKDIFLKAKIQYFVNDQLVEYQSPEDKLKSHITGAVSQYEREQLIARSKRGKSARQNAGLLGYPFVYGYDYTYKPNGDKEWFINEDEAKIIRRIYQEFIDLVPMHKLAGRLNDEGFRTKKGKLWDRSQIHQITSRSLYIGKAWDTEGKLIDSKIYKPIIDEATFEKAQHIRATVSKTRSVATERVAAYELTGLIRCKQCGAQFFYGCNQKTNSEGVFRKWERYYHSIRLQKYKDCTTTIKRINKKWIENEVVNVVRDEFFQREDQIEQWMRLYKKKLGLEVSQIESDINEAKQQLADTTIKKERIVSAIANGVMTNEDARIQLQTLNVEIKSLEKKVAERQKDLSLTMTGDEGKMIDNLTELFLNFEELRPTKRRMLYQSIFSSMILDENKLTLTLTTGETRKVLIPKPKHGGKR